jgi:glycosyltransferase involved in cell wall biosynthesis
LDVTLVVDALGPQLSGIGRYVRELFGRLQCEPGIERVNFFANGQFIRNPEPLIYGGRTHGRVRLPRWLRRRRVHRRLRDSLIHGPNYFLPPEAENGIITVHDLSVFRYPETHPADRVKRFERQFESSLRRAAHVITDSETVRSELIEQFSLSASSVSAIALGVDSSFRPIDCRELLPAIAEWGLEPGGYGLSVAAFEPRKKILELIAAWSRLPPRLRERHPLVLAGAPGWRNEELHRAISNARSEGWLKYLGYVDEALLPKLYAGARLFVYPSIYEGFGLPPIEAMASGVPALVADRSCLPEVCGEAAAYVDPDDSTALTSAIQLCLEDEGWRREAAVRGLDRAAQFTWDGCVSETVSVYGRAWAR